MVNSLSIYPDAGGIVKILLADARAVLGTRLVGLYLHGSLASGDFNPQTSDIDFLVVTASHLPPESFLALQEMHARLFASGPPCSKRLEGAYIPRHDLRRHDPAHTPVPWVGVDGHFAFETLGSDWIIQRWILREKGIVIAGPPLAGLIDPVSPEELRAAVGQSLQEWWSPPFPSPERFQSGEYRVYAVLTMCRSLYVLDHGRVASKPEAARWATQAFKEPWQALVASATAWRPGMEFNHYDATVGLILLTLQEWGLTPSK
jgi:hypothetical protein